MKADVVLSDDITVLKAARRILKTCQVRHYHESVLWRGKEFCDFCSGDCGSCGVAEVLELLIKIGKKINAKETKEKKD